MGAKSNKEVIRIMPKKSLLLLHLFTVLLLLNAACGGDEAAPATPIPPVAEEAEAAPAAAAPPADPTATLIPTQPPPPPTIAPVPTSTLPAASPTPAVEVINLFTPEDFGTDRNPLTGELVSDPALLERRPLAIKISNAPAQFVRPQSGLNSADIVYEHTAEGSVTRFTIIVYGETPPTVGPIRSARLIDLELPAMYDAALIYSGTSVGVGQRLNASDFIERVLRTNEPGYYRSGENKPFEHTLYAYPDQLWNTLENKGLNTAPNFNTTIAFSSQTPPNGRPATYASIDYKSTFVEWSYDEASGQYRRVADNAPISDANDNEQVSVSNVVLISPFHVEDGSICEQIANGVCVALSVEIQLWGSGTGLLLRDGQAFDISWNRQGRNDPLTFTDAAGNPVPLQIGQTWVQLIPSWLTDPLVVAP